MAQGTQILSINDTIQLANTTITIPRLGFGVYKIPPEKCATACLSALAAGYLHIDTAQLYRNEASVGAAIAGLAAPVFTTTKIGFPRGSPDKTYRSAIQSVARIAGEDGCVDLFLVHVPPKERKRREELWLVLEKLYHEGRARCIGVSNYREWHVEEMREYATVWPPHVNQIELHPWCQQRALVKYCEANNITIQAYSPLARASRLSDPTVLTIASKHEKSPAQVLIRYSLQKGWIPLPKSETPERIKENADVFGFQLDETDMGMLDALDEGSKGACFPANVD